MATLEERLARLERRNEALEARNRRWNRSGLAVLAAGGVALLMGQGAAKDGDKTRFKTIEAQQISIVDEAGKVRIEIGVDKDGAGLDVQDANGKVRLSLGLDDKDNPGFEVHDANGRARISLGLDKDGAGLEIRGPNDKRRVAIGEGDLDGNGDVNGSGAWVFDEKERPRVGLGVGKGGNGLIVLDEDGKPVAVQGK